MNPDQQPPEKRRCGHPKGSKNGPNAGTTGRPVGRPRKDGSIRVPKVINTGRQTAPLQSTTTGVGSHNSDTTGSTPPAATPSSASGVSPAPSADADLHVTDANVVQTSTTDTNAGFTADNSGDLQNGATSHSGRHTFVGSSCKHLDPLQQYDEQLLCDYNKDEDDDIFDGIDAEVEYMHDEFAPLADDNDNVLQGAAVPTSPENTKVKIPRSTMPKWLHDDLCSPVSYLMKFSLSTSIGLIFSYGCLTSFSASLALTHGQPVMLRVLGWLQQPRQVVDLEHLVFIIGHRYHCGHEECKKMFQSWSPAVMRVLPPPLVALFPFHLTYRCGLTDRVVGVLQTSFQRGIGPSPFAKPVPLDCCHHTILFHGGMTPSGYAGYVPSHRFFRAFYDSLIESHAAEMDQHMAMQSAEGLSHDHSYKVTGILGKVNGCLHWTMFMWDKSALEQAFPSLLHDVSPVPSSTLDDLALPDGWHLCGVDDDGELFVAMDLEWPVDRETGIYGKVSLISFAYDKAVYLIPIAQYVQDDGFLKLPSSLLVVLRSKRIRKLGVQVKADLTRLYNDCGFSNSGELLFAGALELGSMAKDRNMTDHTRDPSVRVSTRWDDPELSSEQETYAALDVYAAWAIYKAFLTIPSIGPVTPSTPAGTHVQLMSHTRVVVTVTSISVPAYLVRAELLSSRQETPLSTLGTQLPFSLLCCQRDLHTCTECDQAPNECKAPARPCQPISDSTLYHMENVVAAEQAVDLGEPSLLAEDELDISLLEQVASDAEKDPRGLQQAESLAELVSCAVSIKNTEIHSLDPEDRAAVEKVLETKNTSFRQMVLTSSDWIWQWVKWLVPPPEILAPLEGGIHQNIIRHFGSFNASPRLTVNLLRDYTLTHNLKVGTLNRKGRPYLGSHDIWTHNQIARLVDITTNVIQPSYQECGLATWLNGDDLSQQESPLADYAKGCKIKHDYLAGQQQTPVAVLPVHTVEEKALYRLLLKSNTGQFSGKKQLNWITLAQEWQRHANGTSIFYKLPEHLKSYFKTWNEHQNEHNLVEQNKSTYDELQKLLAIPVGMPEITLAQHKTVADQIVSGAQPAASDEPSDWQIGVILGHNSSWQTLLQLQYSGPAPAGPRGQKQPAEESVAPIQVKQHAQCMCKWCCKADCPGKFRSRPCKYKPSNSSGQQSLNSLQHDAPTRQSAPQHPDPPTTGLSAPLSVQNVARTKNVSYTFFYPSAAFNMGRNSPFFSVPPATHRMSDGTVRTSTNAQASTSRLANSPSSSNHEEDETMNDGLRFGSIARNLEKRVGSSMGSGFDGFHRILAVIV
ncbi:hypothetical protein DFH29DRAFT_1066800 [Suillus ampliporus]|nr:hypothetical protein DFH29DRAFT_1066800 [Suillus ampliporus]